MEQQQLTSTQAILKARAIDTLMDSSREYTFERRQLVAAGCEPSKPALEIRYSSLLNRSLTTGFSRLTEARSNISKPTETKCWCCSATFSPKSSFALSNEDATDPAQPEKGPAAWAEA